MGNRVDVEPLIASFERALHDLEGAPEPREALRGAVLDAATALLDHPMGIGAVAQRAHRFEAAGLFAGSPWEHADRLLPHLVSGGLRGVAYTPMIEICSELRVLAIAQGRVRHPELTAADARSFLRSVVVHNLDLLGGAGSTEEARARPEVLARASHLVHHLIEQLEPSAVLAAVVDEIDQLCCQRPIRTRRARRLIALAAGLVPQGQTSPEIDLLETYRHAAQGPSPLSQRCPEQSDYRAALPTLDERDLDIEIRSLASSLRVTGLAAPHHATLLRYLSEVSPERIAPALGLDPTGAANLTKHLPFVQELVDVAVDPDLCDGILGLAGTLERGLLSRRAVSGGIRRLFDLDIHPVQQNHLLSHVRSTGLTAHAALVSGTLSVLGQPLGVGQGNNPTCQSARGISLWSMHAPGYLLKLLVSAARDDSLTLDFEGQPLVSGDLTGGVATSIDLDLDPVSIVLVPHLDRVYDEMMRRAGLRGEDPHRWVNPAFYGRWVPQGFACAVNTLSNSVTDFDGFARRFFATHHPSCNDGDDLIYPNPVGIFVTDVHGRLLGAHAVSLRRVEVDGSGVLRVYFFNPNNEGRQDWGLGVVTSVRGNGEIPGESSLPFDQFASRLYAFHFHLHEGGAPEGVPDRAVAEVRAAAMASWGRTYVWTPPNPA